jgi:hypothetical protein
MPVVDYYRKDGKVVEVRARQYRPVLANRTGRLIPISRRRLRERPNRYRPQANHHCLSYTL